jgi:hypothetical protein
VSEVLYHHQLSLTEGEMVEPSRLVFLVVGRGPHVRIHWIAYLNCRFEGWGCSSYSRSTELEP